MIGVAVLAAGRSERFGGDTPKQLVPFGGRPLFHYALDAARASELQPRLCVVSDERVAAAVPHDFEIVWNDAPERGIASSLQSALRALEPRADVIAVVIGLADQPLVSSAAYSVLGMTGAHLTYVSYDGVRGNPVKIPRALWPEAMELTGDEGARVLFSRHVPDWVSCDGIGDPTDIDTPEDLAALEKTWRSQTASE